VWLDHADADRRGGWPAGPRHADGREHGARRRRAAGPLRADGWPLVRAVPRARWAGLWLLCVAALVATVLAGLALAAPASQASGVHRPTVVVVQPDDTLWSIASRHLPDRDPYRAVDEIRRLNDLPDHVIHPGQHLLVPSR
jgi:hypothetical protein